MADQPGKYMAKPATLRRLGKAKVLHIKESAFCSGVCPDLLEHLAFDYDNWTALLERLDTLANKDRFLKITSLKVQCHMSVQSLLLPLLSLVGFQLVRLRLENLFDPNVVVGTILVLCPRLAHLYVSYHSDACLQTKTMYEGAESTRLPEELRLRSLCLDQVTIEEAALFTILASCPILEELRLTALKNVSDRNPPGTPEQEHLLAFTRPFFRRLAALCPRIRILDVSTDGDFFLRNLKGPTGRTLKEMFTLFPCLTETILVGRDTCPEIFKALDSHLCNTVTVLEITGIARTSAGDHLHAYLCDSPHLLDLKAPKVDFSSVWLDLEGILSQSGRHEYRQVSRTFSDLHDYAEERYIAAARASDYGRPGKKKIWACRNLRTLDLMFYQNEDCDAEDSSRMIFSYLSKVCPQLEDLTIRRKWLDLSLPAGFCLLSRLQKLRRLRLITSQIKPLVKRDLAWISKYMTPGQKLKLMAALAPYRLPRFSQIYSATPFRYIPLGGQRSLRDRILTSSERGRQSIAQSDQDAGVDYILDGIDMRGLGRLQDVVQHATKRFVDSTCCWPQLEFLQVSPSEHSSFIHGGAVGKWIKAFRPAVEVVY
ncbi:hypothetical protein BGZ72_003591 [Mortierella alpina]|nr:hypothetical protein BGZ72_003591 [Mortierella alpina]